MTQSEHGSITRLIGDLKAGDGPAALALWQRYFPRLTRLAGQRLARRRAGVVEDEEDAALSAFHSFCQGVARGRFPKLGDREDLWRLLVVITARKVAAQLQRGGAQKRGGAARAVAVDLDAIIAQGPTPDFAAMMNEQYQDLLDKLGDDDLRQVAIWRMEGRERAEIAQRLGCAVRTVARRLDLIRQVWASEVD